MAKSWLITGASSGLGRALTERLLERGDRVAATVRTPGSLDALAQRFGNALWVGHAELTDAASLRSAVDGAFGALGRIDAVVGNAGYGAVGAVEEFTDEQVERQIATNFTGTVQFIRAVVPHLRAQGGGHYLQLSSALGQIVSPTASLYAATKWAVEGLCEGLAMEVGAFGIKVTIVEPGAVNTDFGGRSVDRAEPMPIYKDTTVGRVREMMASFQAPGDPQRMAQSIIACVDSGTYPLRLLLGADAYPRVTKALQDRLDAYHANRDTTFAASA